MRRSNVRRLWKTIGKKSLAVERAKQEKEGKIFRDRVLYEADLAREKAEQEQESTSKRKDKGKGPS